MAVGSKTAPKKNPANVTKPMFMERLQKQVNMEEDQEQEYEVDDDALRRMHKSINKTLKSQQNFQ